MNLMATKYVSHHAPRTLNLIGQNLLRRRRANDSCNPPYPQTKEPCSSPPTPTSTCPDPPPCPPLSPCPPSICPPIANSSDPCNYCPPPCIDPDYPDITNLKKTQCKFQKATDVPVFLMKGKSDAILFQITCVATYVGMGLCIYYVFKLS